MKTLKDMVKHGVLIESHKDIKVYEFEEQHYIYNGKNLIHVYTPAPKYNENTQRHYKKN